MRKTIILIIVLFIYQTAKTQELNNLRSVVDRYDKAEKEKIEASLKDLQEAIKSDNKDEIEAKNKALAEASQKLGEKVYAEQQAQQQTSESKKDGKEEKTVDAEVVDADFEEVKEDQDTQAEKKSDK